MFPSLILQTIPLPSIAVHEMGFLLATLANSAAVRAGLEDSIFRVCFRPLPGFPKYPFAVVGNLSLRLGILSVRAFPPKGGDPTASRAHYALLLEKNEAVADSNGTISIPSFSAESKTELLRDP